MSSDIHLKVDKETCISIVNNQIDKLNKLDDISAIKNEFKNMTKNIGSIIGSRNIVGKLESKSMYKENEYDVQRILYSIIKPIFPEARLEVQNDTGFGAVRYDIIIEKFSVIIEVKCSRKSMTERTLTEEIGSDIVHYKGENIFFFIYDKEKIIKNVTAFIDTYTSKFDYKNINAVVIQPRIL